MTIATTIARASALVSAGTANNPFVTGAMADGTASTTTGTEVLAASNATTGSTYDPWVVTPASGDAVWQYVFGAAQEVSFIGIAAHNVTSVVTVAYSTNSGASWTDVGTITPTGDVAMGFRFSPVTADYWRVSIAGASGDQSIGVIWIGSEIIIPQRIYQGYAPPLTPTIVDLNTNVTEGAQLVSTAFIERGSNLAAELNHIPDTFIRGADWLAFQTRWNRGEGAFWAWRPGKYGDLFYAWRGAGNVIQPTNAGPRALMSFGMQGRAYHV